MSLITKATHIADIGLNNAFMFAGGSAIGATVSGSTAAAITATVAAPIVVTAATVAGAMIGVHNSVATGRNIHESFKERQFENLGHQVPFFLSNVMSVPTFGMMGLLNLSHLVAATASTSTASATLAVGAGVIAPVAPIVGIIFATLMGIGSSVLATRSCAARKTLKKMTPDEGTEKVKALIKKSPFAFSASLSKIAVEVTNATKLIEVAKKDNAKQIKKYLIITAVALAMIAVFALMIAFPPGIAAVAIVSGVLFIALGATGLYLNPLRQNDEKYEEELKKMLELEASSLETPLLD